MAGHLSPLTEKETSALGSARIHVGDGQRVALHLLLRVPDLPPPGSNKGLGRGGSRLGALPSRRAQASPSDLRCRANPASGAHPGGLSGPSASSGRPPLTLPPPAPVWPGLAAAAVATVAAIGLRPAASPSPGSRRGAVSACVARGGVGWGRLCVRPRLDRTRSGAGCKELGTRRPLPAGHRHPDP